MLKWYEQIVPDGDVVISSRVRLARNLEDYRFLHSWMSQKL